MNEFHEANRRHWDESANAWQKLRDRDELWKVCPLQPQLAFEGMAFQQIRTLFPDLRGKKVCVVGSGDNLAAFALAGCGAEVTSVDISQRQLDIAKERAELLNLDIRFFRSDATNLSALTQNHFELVVSSNGFFVWISRLDHLFSALMGILRTQGLYVSYDVHPFLRPWGEQTHALTMAKPYGDRGPFINNDGSRTYEYHWTLGDILNAQATAGFVLKEVHESASTNPRFWQDFSYEPSTDAELLDWRQNPRSGLPAWLTVTALKP